MQKIIEIANTPKSAAYIYQLFEDHVCSGFSDM